MNKERRKELDTLISSLDLLRKDINAFDAVSVKGKLEDINGQIRHVRDDDDEALELAMSKLESAVEYAATMVDKVDGVITGLSIFEIQMNEVLRDIEISIKKIPRKTLSEAGRAQFRATLDINSVRLMETLSRKLELRRSALASMLITQLKGDQKVADGATKFYREVWPPMEPRSINDSKLFNWPIEIDDALRKLSWSVIGTGNKSEMIRVMLAYFAKQNKLPLQA